VRPLGRTTNERRIGSHRIKPRKNDGRPSVPLSGSTSDGASFVVVEAEVLRNEGPLDGSDDAPGTMDVSERASERSLFCRKRIQNRKSK